MDEIVGMHVKSRRQAREVALQVLYQCDTLEDWSDEAIELCHSCFLREDDRESAEARAHHREYIDRLVNGVRRNLESIDRRISAASENWSFARMARVDRNILRVAVFEICFEEDVPEKVSINEAIEIARKFGSSETPAFVNGILDRVASSLRQAA